MRQCKNRVFLLFFIITLLTIPLVKVYASHGDTKEIKYSEGDNKVLIAGHIKDTHNEPIKEVEVKAYVEEKLVGEVVTSSDGGYTLEFFLPSPPEKVKLEVWKHCYEKKEIIIEEFAKKDNEYYARVDLELKNIITPAFYLAAFILLGIYVLIALEVLHRTLAALLGAALMLFISYTIGTYDKRYFIISFEDAMHAIDMNVIFLLMGMMIIVAIMKKTGVFQWLAYKSYAMAKGRVYRLAVILMFVTGVTSAFLDNVTTMLLLTPVTIEICLVLGISPLALLIPEVLASNIGGTATLIGDPPNIMIGSYANLTFNDFVINLTPVVLISMVVQAIMMKFYYGREYKKAKVKNVDEVLERLKEEYKITDRKLLNQSLAILGFVILLFIVHGRLHMEPSIAALIGASLLLLISKENVVHMLEEVEWSTLVFFMGLFIIVGGAEETGLIKMIADGVKTLSGGDLVKAIALIMWVSAFMSAFVDNIPFTATMLPIVSYLTSVIPGAENNVLWWALSIGACFGGNGTLVGASANIVTAGLAEKAGYPVTFMDFLKIGMLTMIVTTAIGMVWLILVY